MFLQSLCRPPFIYFVLDLKQTKNLMEQGWSKKFIFDRMIETGSVEYDTLLKSFKKVLYSSNAFCSSLSTSIEVLGRPKIN